MSAPVVFTVAEVSAILKCGPKVVRTLIRLGTLKATRIDQRGTVRVSQAALEAFLRGDR
jgi:excisionase family DNA binding protein